MPGTESGRLVSNTQRVKPGDCWTRQIGRTGTYDSYPGGMGGNARIMETKSSFIDSRANTEFESLVARTKRQAYNMAYRMTGNRDDAEDLTQEAYLRAYRSFSTYNRQLPFESWFFRILSNLFIDLMRRRPKVKPLSLDQPVGEEEHDDNMLLQIPDEQANPERNLLDQVMDEKLQ